MRDVCGGALEGLPVLLFILYTVDPRASRKRSLVIGLLWVVCNAHAVETKRERRAETEFWRTFGVKGSSKCNYIEICKCW